MKSSTKTKLEQIRWRIRTRVRTISKQVGKTKDSIIAWCEENPTEAATIIVGLGVAGFKSSQSLIVSHRNQVERNRIDKTWYDPHTGMHWDLKRKPTNNDRIAITEMLREGLSAGEALDRRKLI